MDSWLICHKKSLLQIPKLGLHRVDCEKGFEKLFPKPGAIAEEEKLYLIDSLVYSYVQEHTSLLAGDKHFRNKPFVNLIDDDD